MIGGRGSPGVDIETVEQERCAAFTASHLGALMRLAQLARALGASLTGWRGAGRGRGGARARARRRAAAAAARADRRRAEPVDRRRRRAEGARDVAASRPRGCRSSSSSTGRRSRSTSATRSSASTAAGPAPERLRAVAPAAEPCGARVHVLSETTLGEPLSIFPLTVLVQRIALELGRAARHRSGRVRLRRPRPQGGLDGAHALGAVDRKETQMAKQLVLLTYTPRELDEDGVREVHPRDRLPRVPAEPAHHRLLVLARRRERPGPGEFTHFDLMAVDDLANWQAIVVRPGRGREHRALDEGLVAARARPPGPGREPEDLLLPALLGLAPRRPVGGRDSGVDHRQDVARPERRPVDRDAERRRARRRSRSRSRPARRSGRPRPCP